jgi:hypothetical protein
MTESRRWDTDERGHGVADAKANLPAIQLLMELAGLADWVTEDPEAHLLSKMRAKVEAAGMIIKSVAVEPDGALSLKLEALDKKRPRELREAVWTILGGVAELSTHVHETQAEGSVLFEVVTGIPPNQGPFATHGHTLRIRIERS